MKISLISARALTARQKEKWSLIQQSDPDFASPFFCPEFTSSLALYRDDIYVAVMEEDGDAVGFFPFVLGKHAIAKPMYMCDYQGVIVKKGIVWKIEDILRRCDLVAWDFSELIISQANLQKNTRVKVTAHPVINLSKGYGAYIAELRRKRAGSMANIFRKIRKIEREVGRIDFKNDVLDMSVLHKVFKWKSDKFREGRAFDAWAAKTLENIFLTRNNRFKGTLSAIYAGDKLVAAHFGMRSAEIAHWWFPAYDKRFEKYSPGIILLLKMAEAFSLDGVKIVDFGGGDDNYKVQFGNDHIDTGEGYFGVSSALIAIRKPLRAVKESIRNKPYLYIPLKKVLRIVRKNDE